MPATKTYMWVSVILQQILPLRRDDFMTIIMVLNPGICTCMLIGNHDAPDKINRNDTEIRSTKKEKLFGFLMDKKLSRPHKISMLQRRAKSQYFCQNKFLL